MKHLFITMTALFTLLLQPISSSAEETLNSPLSYTDNHNKTFMEEDEFYNTLDKEIYKEYENAAYSLRQKISFKDVPKSHSIFNVKTNLHHPKLDLQHQTDIHPNRQVYFMASFYQNVKEEYHKYAVIDAETKKVLLGGNHYHLYVNSY